MRPSHSLWIAFRFFLFTSYFLGMRGRSSFDPALSQDLFFQVIGITSLCLYLKPFFRILQDGIFHKIFLRKSRQNPPKSCKREIISIQIKCLLTLGRHLWYDIRVGRPWAAFSFCPKYVLFVNFPCFSPEGLNLSTICGILVANPVEKSLFLSFYFTCC